MAMTLPDPATLAARIQRGERAAVASGLNLVDDARPQARSVAAELLAALAQAQALDQSAGRAHCIGITGPPGAGKSSLVSALIRAWRRPQTGASAPRVAVLAVDPSSRPEAGGGALLGDRIRIKSVAEDDGVFIRSLATRNRLGGIASEVWPMAQLLSACFDLVVVETVGVGQTEIDIARIADTVCYVAQPASGDSIQYLKSGIMEIPDVFAVNKADLGAAAHKTASEIARIGQRPDRVAGWDYPVCLVSASEGTGIAELVASFARHHDFLRQSGALAERRSANRVDWMLQLLREEFGSVGLALVQADAPSFNSANAAAGELRARLAASPGAGFHEFAQVRAALLERFSSSSSFSATKG